MKILIISDSHGKNKNIELLFQKIKERDLVIHLGDLQGSEHYLEDHACCPVEMIAGNNDFYSELDREKELFIGTYKVLLTHGHRRGVQFGWTGIKDWGRENQAQIVMFGHTHIPFLDMSSDVILVNPGSISQPRQDGHRPSYMLMELDRNGIVHFTLNYL